MDPSQIAIHQAELRIEIKCIDQKYSSIKSLHTEYLNLDRSSGSIINNDRENIVQTKCTFCGGANHSAEKCFKRIRKDKEKARTAGDLDKHQNECTPCKCFIWESFQLQMEFSFPFLHVNDLHTSLLITITRCLSYVGLFLDLIANAVNNNDQHVRSGTNVRMSQNPHLRRKRMGTGIIIARRRTITLQPGQGRAA